MDYEPEEHGRKLLQTPLVYPLLPTEIHVEFVGCKEELLDADSEVAKVEIVLMEDQQRQQKKGKEKAEERIGMVDACMYIHNPAAVRQFIRCSPPLSMHLTNTYIYLCIDSYILYHARKRAPAINMDVLKAGFKMIRKEFIGARPVVDQMETHFLQFASESPPRGLLSSFPPPFPLCCILMAAGILFWGPPGNGKTSLIKSLCEKLEVTLVCPPLAAGDFNQGIVGDSEKMINHIAHRARSVSSALLVNIPLSGDYRYLGKPVSLRLMR